MPTIKLRRGTSSQWISANPVLAGGEPGFETDTQKLKIGNGLLTWTELPYILDVDDLSEFYPSLADNHTISGQWDFEQAPTVNGSPIGTDGGTDLTAVMEALSGKASKYGETYEGSHDFSGATVLGLTTGGSGGVGVVKYVASLSTARPDATLVLWLGYPAEPTNMSDNDIWAMPTLGEFEVVEYDSDTPNLDAARPMAKVVAWLGFPAQPVNIADRDLWAQPEGV